MLRGFFQNTFCVALIFYPLFNHQIRKINEANSANKMAILRTTIICDSLGLPLQL